MKILIDTNIFLDVILKRKGHYIDSAKVWSLISEKKIGGCISAISVNNLYYILNRRVELNMVKEIVDQILEEFEIVSLSKEVLKLSRIIDHKDYEDSIQYISALSAGCEYIITRNQDDFSNIGIKVISPKEFIARLKGSR